MTETTTDGTGAVEAPAVKAADEEAARLETAEFETTWDGLPIAPDDPRGATIVVRRTDGAVLLLHRAHRGPDFEGDWAWTPPAGSRQPDEPILPAALRELAEEAGIEGVPLEPVDLSGTWALFAASVRPDAVVTLVDPEHDRFAWVRPEEAYERVLPAVVSDGMRRALLRDLAPVSFRPLSRAEFPHLIRWQNAPHVAAYWRDRMSTVEACEAKYGPRIDGASATRVDVIEVAGRPVGFIQCTPLAADSPYLDLVTSLVGRVEPVASVESATSVASIASVAAGGEAIVIDAAIGEADLVGVGLGTRVFWAYSLMLFERFPEASHLVAATADGNGAAWRAAEKAGFRPLAEVVVGGERHVVAILDRMRVFGA